jgi:glycosyltransferase involved in cell wall biosynthesis
MNVLFLTNTLEVGGIEKNLVLLSHELAQRGHNVTVASRGGTLLTELCKAPVRHVPLHVAWRPRHLREDISVLRRLLRWAGNNGPGVVHIFSASTAALCAMARLGSRCASGSKRPLFVTSVMGLKNDPGEHQFLTLLRAFVTNLGADRVIVTSPTIGETINALPVPRSKQTAMPVQAVRIIPVDESQRLRDYFAVREEFVVRQGERIVLTIGRLNATKSHELFIRAAAQVCKRRGNVRFLIVGEGEERERLTNEISEQEVDDHVMLLGERLDVHRLLSATDVYVRPGIVEGFVGMTVLEAQTLGIPVVAFSTEDVKLSIEHSLTGWLVPAGDSDALAEAVLGLLDDPKRARRLGEAGRRHVEEIFSLHRVVDGLEALYRGAR